jgi:hypothetical protein
MNKVGFRDNYTYKCRTALEMSDKKIRRLAEFQIFERTKNKKLNYYGIYLKY